MHSITVLDSEVMQSHQLGYRRDKNASESEGWKDSVISRPLRVRVVTQAARQAAHGSSSRVDSEVAIKLNCPDSEAAASPRLQLSTVVTRSIIGIRVFDSCSTATP